MRKITKHSLVCMCVLSMLFVSGCSKEEEKEPVVEEIKIVNNNVYEAPVNPTKEQANIYNELSQALTTTTSTDESIAGLVAKNFAYEFYTLYGKSDKNAIGGLTFIPEISKEEFKTYALSKYYKDYDTIVSKYSKEDLPNVTAHQVGAITANLFTYNGLVYDGFLVPLTLTYAQSKIDSATLKTKTNVQVIDMNGVYYVVAAEE